MIAPGHHNMKPRAKVPVCLRASANRANNHLQLTGSNKFNPRASIIVCNYYAVVFKGEMRIALLTFAHYDTECYIMHAPFRT